MGLGLEFSLKALPYGMISTSDYDMQLLLITFISQLKYIKTASITREGSQRSHIFIIVGRKSNA